MIQADSDDEGDDYLDKAKGVAKKARIISAGEANYENNSKLGGVKRKYYSVGAKDVKNPKRSRRVKTAATSKISSHRPAPPRLFPGSRFGVRNTYYSDGRILTSLSIHYFNVIPPFFFHVMPSWFFQVPVRVIGKVKIAIISLLITLVVNIAMT